MSDNKNTLKVQLSDDKGEVAIDLEDRSITLDYYWYPTFGGVTLVDLDIDDFRRLSDMFFEASERVKGMVSNDIKNEQPEG